MIFAACVVLALPPFIPSAVLTFLDVLDPMSLVWLLTGWAGGPTLVFGIWYLVQSVWCVATGRQVVASFLFDLIFSSHVSKTLDSVNTSIMLLYCLHRQDWQLPQQPVPAPVSIFKMEFRHCCMRCATSIMQHQDCIYRSFDIIWRVPGALAAVWWWLGICS
ncbi:hypothetical protein COO60DRAFT_99397 [Scenedesmus sp. NREL 46B-D3]|nr:hypothetical protein COO60DRAFT_99397 [Scenedesmus sp. NREL 46B-D3]